MCGAPAAEGGQGQGRGTAPEQQFGPLEPLPASYSLPLHATRALLPLYTRYLLLSLYHSSTVSLSLYVSP